MLFCDLVGSTALSSRMDPEDLRELLIAYRRCIKAVVTRYHGFIAQHLGDGALVYFGYPVAQEDDAAQAVRAALALVHSVQELEVGSERLQARVGLATGVAVVGDPVAAGDGDERGIVGETPNLAARLQSTASPGSVLICGSTKRLVERLFQLHSIGPLQLKGLPRVVEAWHVISEHATEWHDAPASFDIPLIGREGELGRLSELWRRAAGGQGCTVVISGEPGIGKSRLVASFRQRTDAERPTRLRFFCSPHHSSSPFHPLIEQLRKAAGIEPRDSRAAAREKLLRVLARPDRTEDGEVILDLASHGADSLPSGQHNARQRQVLLAALVRQVEQFSKTAAVQIFWEDIHWIDPSSKELLTLLIAHTAHLPVLLVATARPGFGAQWIDLPQIEQLRLRRLSARQNARLVRCIAGASLKPDVVEQIVAQTDGVPLFVEELTKATVESGGDIGIDGSSRGGAVFRVPESLQGALTARLDRLGSARKIAQVGAVIGREFSYRLLRHVLDWSDERLSAALDRLTASGLAWVRGAPPDAMYSFKHVMIQDVAYESILRSERRAAHARIVSALQEQLSDIAETQPEVLARHAALAGLAQLAAEYWLRAGRLAVARSGDVEAIQQLRRGLECLDKLPPSPDRDRLEIDLQLALGGSLIAVNGYAHPEVAVAYDRADALCEVLGDSRNGFTSLYGQCVYYNVSGQPSRALELARRALAASERRNDPFLTLLSHRMLGAPLFLLGDCSAACQHFEYVLNLRDFEQDASIATQYVVDPYATAAAFSATALYLMGRTGAARERLQQGMARALQLRHVTTLCHIYAGAGIVVDCLRGDSAAVLAQAEKMLELAVQHDLRIWKSVGGMAKGWALACAGNTESGIASILRGAAEIDAAGTTWGVPIYLTMLVDAYQRGGNIEHALRAVEDAEARALRTEQNVWLPELYRIKGGLQHRYGDTAAAKESLQSSIQTARQYGIRLIELRAITTLAHLQDAPSGGGDSLVRLKEALSALDHQSTCPDVTTAPARALGDT